MNRQEAKAKAEAEEALHLATEADDPKHAQAIAVISTHWLALASTMPSGPGITPEGYL